MGCVVTYVKCSDWKHFKQRRDRYSRFEIVANEFINPTCSHVTVTPLHNGGSTYTPMDRSTNSAIHLPVSCPRLLYCLLVHIKACSLCSWKGSYDDLLMDMQHHNIMRHELSFRCLFMTVDHHKRQARPISSSPKALANLGML